MCVSYVVYEFWCLSVGLCVCLCVGGLPVCDSVILCVVTCVCLFDCLYIYVFYLSLSFYLAMCVFCLFCTPIHPITLTLPVMVRSRRCVV
jgi:hypothetical protein